jgi:alpha-methylacyl-CoA racemase
MALQGVRVLDMSRLLPGPLATQFLVDLGAEVIKVFICVFVILFYFFATRVHSSHICRPQVEDTAGGDYARYYPPLAADGSSAVFHSLNRGKKSVVLNVKKPADKDAFLKLLATADVLVETFRPEVMAKLGLSPRDLVARFPKLIVCSISGYGQVCLYCSRHCDRDRYCEFGRIIYINISVRMQDGPAALRAGHDLNYLARAGVLGMMKVPTTLPVQVADIAGGTYPAVVQILAALLQRQKTGKGCVIDVAMTDWAHALMVC